MIMQLIVGLVIIAIVMSLPAGFLAKRRGFSPWLWRLAIILAFTSMPGILLGIIGFIILLLMSSAVAEGIDEVSREKRRKKGNKVAVILIVIAVILNIGVWISIFSTA
jgi:hypothetical protein